jgi:neutral ceramidase
VRVYQLVIVLISAISAGSAVGAPSFTAGAASIEITPPAGLPMWGYSARHDARATGAIDPLRADAAVIEADGEKLAIVGVDLGRGPTPAMMAAIRRDIAKVGIKHVLICASHTHHGPVIELADKPGRGRGKFTASIFYGDMLAARLVSVILAADTNRRPAKIGTGSKPVEFNRNRQAKRDPKPIDTSLGVIRLDDESDRPIAILVNYAAHPTMTDARDLRYSADYPGAMRAKVSAAFGAPCIFLQGAAGDLTTRPPDGVRGAKAFGEALADRAIEVARSIRTTQPAEPAIAVRVETMRFKTRIDLTNPLVIAAYSRAFFPELIAAMADEFANGVHAELNTVLLNGTIAIVAVSGEFFCDHANRLRLRSGFEPTMVVGYCNGHHLYFPTIEAVVQGGYGTEPGTSLAELGAGERMMDQALIDLYTLQGKFAAERR